MKPEIIIALDFPSGEKALSFLDKFENEKLYVKVGMELFYGEGPSIVKEIKGRGHKVFLDLKLHDIPNTVKSAMKVLASVGADMVNVHAAGGIKMMKAAVEGLEEGSAGGIRPQGYSTSICKECTSGRARRSSLLGLGVGRNT